IADLARGYIVTNSHVVAGADEISVKLANERVYDGQIVGRDENTDIAIIKVKNEKFDRRGLGQLSFAERPGEVRVGDLVIALGAPFGLEASLSFGVISALGRGTLGITKLGNFIQT